jgi:GT2 family glycosyltransferase
VAAERSPGNGRPVDVVVLAYGREQLLGACVSAVLSSEHVDVTVYVVDNGAVDPVGRLPADARLIVLSPGTNTGFARGCNLGADVGDADTILFVNSDAIVAPGAIHALARALDDETVGLVTGCVLLSGTQTQDGETATSELETLRVNAAGNPVHWLGFSWCGGYGRPRPEFATPRDVASISGALFAVRRAHWRALGGFDPMYFAYHEDVDLSLRTWCHGKRVVYEPAAMCVHHYDFSRHPGKSYLLERNRLITWLTVPSSSTLRALAVPMVLTQFLLLAYALTHHGSGSLLKAWWWLLRHPSTVRKRRRSVQEARHVSDAAWILLSEPVLNPPDPAGVRVPAAVNAILRLGHRRFVAQQVPPAAQTGADVAPAGAA